MGGASYLRDTPPSKVTQDTGAANRRPRLPPHAGVDVLLERAKNEGWGAPRGARARGRQRPRRWSRLRWASCRSAMRSSAPPGITPTPPTAGPRTEKLFQSNSEETEKISPEKQPLFLDAFQSHPRMPTVARPSRKDGVRVTECPEPLLTTPQPLTAARGQGGPGPLHAWGL